MNLPDELLASADGPEQEARSALREFRDKTEREFIIGVLRRQNGNVTQAAMELGVSRPYLHKRMAVLRIAKKDFYA